MSKPWIELREAKGRTVKQMIVALDEEYLAVEIEFEDEHSMNVSIIPAVQIRPQFQHIGTGDAKILKNYKARMHPTGLNIKRGE